MQWYTLAHTRPGSVVTCPACGYNRLCAQCPYCGNAALDDVLHTTSFKPDTVLLPRSKTHVVQIVGDVGAVDNYIASRRFFRDPRDMARIRSSSGDMLYTAGVRVPLGPLGRSCFHFLPARETTRHTLFYIVSSAATPALSTADMTVSASTACPSHPYAALSGAPTHRAILRWRRLHRRSLVFTVTWCMENPFFTGIVHVAATLPLREYAPV